MLLTSLSESSERTDRPAVGRTASPALSSLSENTSAVFRPRRSRFQAARGGVGNRERLLVTPGVVAAWFCGDGGSAASICDAGVVETGVETSGTGIIGVEAAEACCTGVEEPGIGGAGVEAVGAAVAGAEIAGADGVGVVVACSGVAGIEVTGAGCTVVDSVLVEIAGRRTVRLHTV